MKRINAFFIEKNDLEITRRLYIACDALREYWPSTTEVEPLLSLILKKSLFTYSTLNEIMNMVNQIIQRADAACTPGKLNAAERDRTIRDMATLEKAHTNFRREAIAAEEP